MTDQRTEKKREWKDDWKFHTIETSDGTVCRQCLLWLDTCTCNPDHPLRQILEKARP